MNPRVVVALVWGLLVTVALLLIPPALRDRLPDPMAVHWGSGGADGSSSFSVALVANALFWVVPWLAALALALRGQVLARRLSQIYWCGGVAFWSFWAGASRTSRARRASGRRACACGRASARSGSAAS
ncbi:hypothetical protein ABGB18_21685 [Nonomuraea sp. B12E4]|uniref:hypothetical protein n=1 Tax=Nonomuraea sp. B12E4 TaxID=3153564 RepID=UPI00325D20AD